MTKIWYFMSYVVRMKALLLYFMIPLLETWTAPVWSPVPVSYLDCGLWNAYGTSVSFPSSKLIFIVWWQLLAVMSHMTKRVGKSQCAMQHHATDWSECSESRICSFVMCNLIHCNVREYFNSINPCFFLYYYTMRLYIFMPYMSGETKWAGCLWTAGGECSVYRGSIYSGKEFRLLTVGELWVKIAQKIIFQAF